MTSERYGIAKYANDSYNLRHRLDLLNVLLAPANARKTSDRGPSQGYAHARLCRYDY